jgi:hypothetical protein
LIPDQAGKDIRNRALTYQESSIEDFMLLPEWEIILYSNQFFK